MIKAVLPKPFSVNHIWKITTKPFPRMYLSEQGRQWFEEAGWIWKQAKGRHKTIEGDVEVCIDLYYCRHLDMDNALKLSLDSMTKSGVIVDDKQVASIVMHRYKVKTMKEERLEMEVFTL